MDLGSEMEPAVQSGVPLSSLHIADALKLPEAPSSLSLCYLDLSEISDDAVQQLVAIRGDDDQPGDMIIHRIALSNNALRALPLSFSVLRRLRYLNLRSNDFPEFPEVLLEMECLEILDLSRNKIKSFPTEPASLLNVRVLHLGRNLITALPTYLPNFRELNLLIINHNPIEWPPRHIIKASAPSNSNDQVAAQKWVSSMQGWIRDHLARYGRPTQMGYVNEEITAVEDPLDGSGNGLRVEENGRRYSAHDRTPSNESVVSQNSNFSHSDAPDSPRDERIINRIVNKLLPPENAIDGYSSSDWSASIDGHGILQPQHGRNASLTYTRKQNGANTLLQGKKSLPELRNMQLRPAERSKPRGRPPLPTTNASTESIPSSASPHLATHHASSFSKGSISDTGHTIRPPRSSTRDEDMAVASASQPPPIDGERNSYFRRMSTLPASTISKAVPRALLVTIDAARGILFALSQIYSALRHYIVFAINDRLAGVLNKVLDPASQYLTRLIMALDRFDGLCRSGVPPPAACRGVLEGCRDSITVFTKVMGILQIQLKVLAGSDDVRYTRTLLLMLYGSMAELSNSWTAMAPHMEEMKNLVKDGRIQSPSLLSGASGGNTPVGQPMLPRTTQTILENEEATPTTRPGQPLPPRPRNPPSTVRRRQGGSFSANDVRKGKEMPTIGRERDNSIGQPLVNPVQPLQIKSASAASKALRSHLKQTAGGSSSGSNQGHHSPSLSSSSHGHGGVPAYGRDPDTMGINGASSADKDKLVDANTLSAMEESTDLALNVWRKIEDLFEAEMAPSDGTGNVIGREYLARTRDLTLALKSNIRAVLGGADGEVYGHALWEGANAFGKDVAKILMFVKQGSKERRFHLEPSLRDDLRKLSQVTQEFITLGTVSSFASGRVPPSPAPSSFASPSVSTPGLASPPPSNVSNRSHYPNAGYASPTLYDERMITPSSANPTSSSFGTSDLMPPSAPLWRSRSANVMGSPPPSTTGRGVGGSMAGGAPPVQWSGPAHPSLRDFRMPVGPAPNSAGRIRPNGGVVGYREPD